MDECFDAHIDHGKGKHTFFGRVATTSPAPEGHIRWANIPVPEGLADKIVSYAVSTTIVVRDSSADNYLPFFPFWIERALGAENKPFIVVKATGPANANRYFCDYIVVATTKAKKVKVKKRR